MSTREGISVVGQQPATICPRYDVTRYNAESVITQSITAPENVTAMGVPFLRHVYL